MGRCSAVCTLFNCPFHQGSFDDVPEPTHVHPLDMLRILAKYGGSMGLRRALDQLTPSGLEEAAREMGLGPTALLELVCPDEVTSDGIRYGLDKEAKLNELAAVIARRLCN